MSNTFGQNGGEGIVRLRFANLVLVVVTAKNFALTVHLPAQGKREDVATGGDSHILTSLGRVRHG